MKMRLLIPLAPTWCHFVLVPRWKVASNVAKANAEQGLQHPLSGVCDSLMAASVIEHAYLPRLMVDINHSNATLA